jgi:hypothetical protein
VLRLATFHKFGWFGILSMAKRALKVLQKPLAHLAYTFQALKYEQYLHVQCIVILQYSMPPVLSMDILPGTRPTQYYKS